jgi:hypothetical protein
MRILTDSEITALIAEEKPLPDKWQAKIKLRPKANLKYEEKSIDVTGVNGHKFRAVFRKSKININDFSIILKFEDSDGCEYRLTRYNGMHPSMHTNKVEKMQRKPDYRFLPCFHIHKATQRYQENGFEIDGFAEPTMKYSDYNAAFDAFFTDNGFTGVNAEGSLF